MRLARKCSSSTRREPYTSWLEGEFGLNCMRAFAVLVLLACLCNLGHADIAVPLTVDNDKNFARVNEPVSSGVPIPRAAQLFSTQSLRLTDPFGATQVAQFGVLGRWDASVNDTTQPIKWVEVQFHATIPRNSQSTYTLTDTGSGSANSPFTIQETASELSIDTGSARFHVSKTNFNLFDRVFLDLNSNGAFEVGEQIVASSPANGTFVSAAGREYRSSASAPRAISLEENGALRAVVRVEGFHRNGSDNLLRYVTRLFFYAGRSYVRVSHTIIEGRVQGQGNTDFPNIVTTSITRAGLRTRIALTAAPVARVKGVTTVHSVSPVTTSASIEQNRLANINSASSFSTFGNGQSLENGTQAINAWIDISDSRAGVALTTQDFYRKNPQRLMIQADGTVEAQIPSQAYSIYQAMGLTDTATFFFHGPNTSSTEIESVMEGLAVDQLFARTTGAYNRTTGAFDELAPFPAPAQFLDYDNLLDGNFDQTRAFINQRRSEGLMNYLDMPTDRFDGSTNPDQVGRGNSYYDPGASMVREYARRSDPSWLKEMFFPLAKHFYTTDMYDTDDSTWYQNGISGARGAYHRGAWTGEYHYMESLWLYYYLTGDRRALERGHQAGRTYALNPNWAIDFDLGHGYAGLPSRMISQKVSTMVDAYLATGDAAIKAALDQQVPAYLNRFFSPHGFIYFGGDIGRNPYRVDQGWMVTQLLHPALYKYFLLTGNQQVRDFLVAAPQRIAQYHRISSDPASPDYYRFYNIVRISVSGNGAISAALVPNGGDDFFYNSEYPGLALALMRSAELAGDAARMQDATAILTRGLNLERAAVLDKPGAKFSQRLATAVGVVTRGSGDPPPSDPTPSPTQPPGGPPVNPQPPIQPGDPNVPVPPGAPDEPGDPDQDSTDVEIWGVNSSVTRGRLSVSIGAHNLPTKFTLQVNRQALKYRRITAEQITFVVPRKRLSRGTKSVAVVGTQNGSTLFVVRINLRDGSYRVL
jgi:hypothetical protein